MNVHYKMTIIFNLRSLIIILINFNFYHIVMSPNTSGISKEERQILIENCKETLKDSFDFTGTYYNDMSIDVEDKVQTVAENFKEFEKTSIQINTSILISAFDNKHPDLYKN
ncbi:uncharacterized protein LOC113549256 isoform X2 [Rhopalosiphum maidis]|uniref:uncharacterized protein LOC113549256 isoform X2 n=1 Tax=Rhopalosiphum maidis TaxID=43146 RepID=UPI000F002D69|nr:uncharacterized protein LOC113549256 isoform X2 [Rhopalosiphum maidis]